MGLQRQVNARLPRELYEHIIKRAKVAGTTPGGYMAGIGLLWLKEGAPPVSDYEARFLAQAVSSAARKRGPAAGADPRKVVGSV